MSFPVDDPSKVPLNLFDGQDLNVNYQVLDAQVRDRYESLMTFVRAFYESDFPISLLIDPDTQLLPRIMSELKAAVTVGVPNLDVTIGLLDETKRGEFLSLLEEKGFSQTVRDEVNELLTKGNFTTLREFWGLLATELDKLEGFNELTSQGFPIRSSLPLDIREITVGDPPNQTTIAKNANASSAALLLGGFLNVQHLPPNSTLAKSIDQLVKSFQTVGIQDPTDIADYSELKLKGWKDYILSAPVLENVVTGSAQPQSLQAAIELIYVQHGNNFINSKLTTLESALGVTKDSLNILKELQNFHNKVEIKLSTLSSSFNLSAVRAGSVTSERIKWQQLGSDFFGRPIIPKVEDLTDEEIDFFTQTVANLDANIAALEDQIPDGDPNEIAAQGGNLLQRVRQVRDDITEVTSSFDSIPSVDIEDLYNLRNIPGNTLPPLEFSLTNPITGAPVTFNGLDDAVNYWILSINGFLELNGFEKLTTFGIPLSQEDVARGGITGASLSDSTFITRDEIMENHVVGNVYNSKLTKNQDGTYTMEFSIIPDNPLLIDFANNSPIWNENNLNGFNIIQDRMKFRINNLTEEDITHVISTANKPVIDKWILDKYDTLNDPDVSKAGSFQQNLTFAITAAESLNDTQKEEVRRFLFIFEEFYKSASAILIKITQILEKVAQNISR